MKKKILRILLTGISILSLSITLPSYAQNVEENSIIEINPEESSTEINTDNIIDSTVTELTSEVTPKSTFKTFHVTLKTGTAKTLISKIEFGANTKLAFNGLWSSVSAITQIFIEKKVGNSYKSISIFPILLTSGNTTSKTLKKSGTYRIRIKSFDDLRGTIQLEIK